MIRQAEREKQMNSYSVYADYGIDDPRNDEYLIGTLEETNRWVQGILDTTTKQMVGQLTLTIKDGRGKIVSVHTVTK
jgi:hypothetical protein